MARRALLVLVLLIGCDRGVLGGGSGTGGTGGDASGGSGGGTPGCAPPSTFYCVAGCSSDFFQGPICVDGAWVCAPGQVPTDSCTCLGLPPPGYVCGDSGWVLGGAGGRGGTGGTGGTAGTGGTGGTGGTVPPPSCPTISTTANTFNACGRTTSLAFSPDGQFLVAGMQTQRPNVHVWRLSDGALVRDIDGIGTVTYDVAVSPDGRTIATAGSLGGGSNVVTPDIVKLWDFDTGALLRTLPAKSGFYASTVAFSLDGTLVATAGTIGPIEVWRVSDGALVTTIPYPTSVHNVHFAPTGTRLIAGGVDRRATVWEIPAGTQLMTLSEIADEMADADFSPDGTEIASTGPGNALVLWNATTGAMLQTLPGHTQYVSHVVWVGPDRLISNDWGGSIRSWTRSPGGAFAASGMWVIAGQSLGIAVSPDGQKLVAGGTGGFQFLPL